MKRDILHLLLVTVGTLVFTISMIIIIVLDSSELYSSGNSINNDNDSHTNIQYYY